MNVSIWVLYDNAIGITSASALPGKTGNTEMSQSVTIIFTILSVHCHFHENPVEPVDIPEDIRSTS